MPFTDIRRPSILDSNAVADKFKLCSRDYNELSNKPSINGCILQGDITLEDLQIPEFVVCCTQAYAESCIYPYVDNCLQIATEALHCDMDTLCSTLTYALQQTQETLTCALQQTQETLTCAMCDLQTCVTCDMSALCSELTCTITQVQNNVNELCCTVTDNYSTLCCNIDCVSCSLTETIQDVCTCLSCDIADINSLVPSQASASNQLADKDFVNSTVGTNTANYICFNGGPFPSVACLEAYSGCLTNNDYAFVCGIDSCGNAYYDRYKYSETTTSWGCEYRLNNSSFTAMQWSAINSGITTALVAKIPNNTPAQKVNNVSADSCGSITITGSNINVSGSDTNTIATAITNLGSSKQDTLNTSQMNAVNSGVTSTNTLTTKGYTTAEDTCNADNLTTDGIYALNGNFTWSNVPVPTDAWGQMIVVHDGISSTRQIYTRWNDKERLYTRSNFGGVWSQWGELVNTSVPNVFNSYIPGVRYAHQEFITNVPISGGGTYSQMGLMIKTFVGDIESGVRAGIAFLNEGNCATALYLDTDRLLKHITNLGELSQLLETSGRNTNINPVNNLNDFVTGIGTFSGTTANLPTNNWYLVVSAGDLGIRIQVAFNLWTGKICNRYMAAGQWGPWNEHQDCMRKSTTDPGAGFDLPTGSLYAVYE